MNDITIEKINNQICGCGRPHRFSSKIVTGAGAVNSLPEIMDEIGAKTVFLLADKNTYSAAGDRVLDALTKSGIKVSKYVFDKDTLEPDETNVGLAIMHFNKECDAVIGVGSGVINDIGKIVASVSDKTYVIVATAPSMDGYASATSSVTREGLKISLPSKCADVIIGDTDILCRAPIKMMIAGLGDMIAKYISICEWRISSLITDEYYCDKIASLVRSALKRCVDNAEGLLKRDPDAVAAVFDGLVTGGVAMNFAGLSRPASGIEHYFSHVWDMRGAAFETPVELHGLQCAVGTLISVGLYEKLSKITPNREKALSYVKSFNYEDWKPTLKEFLGKGAESMIALEAKEQKYNKDKHRERLALIIEKWDEIKKIIKEELPSSSELEALLNKLGAPKTMEDIGLDSSLLPLTFYATKDIRDKYVLSRLAWDLGVIDEL